MTPSIVDSTAHSFIPRQFGSSWKRVVQEPNSLAERATTDNGNPNSMLKGGEIAAIVVPIVLLALGLIMSLGVYVHRKRSRASGLRKALHSPELVTSPDSEKISLDVFAPNSNCTFLVAFPSDQGKMGQDAKVGIVSDKPRVLYVAPGQEYSSTPLKKISEVSHNAPALKINTSALAPPTHDQTSSPLSPRTAASKSPTISSTAPSAKSDFVGKRYRQVIVESTFPITLADELKIRVGECLYLIEEYEDEWCLVQRVGSKEKGVIPRLCVVEKERTPSTKTQNVFRFSAQAIAASKAFKV